MKDSANFFNNTVAWPELYIYLFKKENKYIFDMINR